MSATSAAKTDESQTKNLSSTTTSSYANIVQKDNGDKEKTNVKSIQTGETAKKTASTHSNAATNVPSSNDNNKTNKNKVSFNSSHNSNGKWKKLKGKKNSKTKQDAEFRIMLKINFL